MLMGPVMEGISSRQNVAQTNHNQADICAWGTICGPFAIKHETDTRENSWNVDLSRTGMTCTLSVSPASWRMACLNTVRTETCRSCLIAPF